MALDSVWNHAEVVVSTGYDQNAYTIVLVSGDGSRLPQTPPYNLVWWNFTDYPNPSDDPNREIVRVTAISTDTLTLENNGSSRTAQETTLGGLASSTKNTAGKTYHMSLDYTAGVADQMGKALGHIALISPTSGLINGVNTQFVFATKPDIIFNDHGLYYTTGWTWNAGTNTVTVTVPPNDELYGGYLY